jgi:hypothetical protein
MQNKSCRQTSYSSWIAAARTQKYTRAPRRDARKGETRADRPVETSFAGRVAMGLESD